MSRIYTILLGLGIIVALTYAIYNVFEMRKELKIQGIKAETAPRRIKEPKEPRKQPKFIDQEKVRMKIVRAGNSGIIKIIGLNEYNYFAYKISLAILCLLSVINERNLMKSVGYTVIGYYALDLYLRAKKKRRNKEVKSVLEDFIALTVDGLKQGQTPYDIFAMAIKKLPEKNPLWLEVKILNVKVLKGSFKVALDEFRKRLDMEEIDNYCYALLQYEMGGRAVSMLMMQLNLLQSIKSNKKQRETQKKATLSSVATALLVGAFLMILLVPLVSRFKGLPFGN